MTRRSLFKMLFGVASAPVAVRGVARRTLTYDPRTKSVRFVDGELKRVVKSETERAVQELEALHKRFKIYNIHNSGYRILGERPEVTHYDK